MRIIIIAALVVLAATGAEAQTWNPPADSARCPSKWGAGDQRGAANHMKPDTVLRAARLIRTGQVFELGRRLEEGMPLQTTRTFELHTKRTAPLAGSNRPAPSRVKDDRVARLQRELLPLQRLPTRRSS